MNIHLKRLLLGSYFILLYMAFVAFVIGSLYLISICPIICAPVVFLGVAYIIGSNKY